MYKLILIPLTLSTKANIPQNNMREKTYPLPISFSNPTPHSSHRKRFGTLFSAAGAGDRLYGYLDDGQSLAAARAPLGVVGVFRLAVSAGRHRFPIYISTSECQRLRIDTDEVSHRYFEVLRSRPGRYRADTSNPSADACRVL
jgi:hypothetical protein